MSPFFAAIFLLGLCLANAVNFTTVYEWQKFDFIWPSRADPSNVRIKQLFDPDYVILQYMAVFGERLFLSLIPQPGIPATLVWLPTSGTSTAPPKLAPFPSWHLHKEDKCDTIQRAFGIDTDPDGRLWVLDQGNNKCPGKIWIFNLLNNNKIERVHQFPDAVVSHSKDKRALRDIVLDKTTDDNLAYITEYESEHIIVYSNKNDKSWSVKTPGRKWYSLALSPNNKGKLYLARRGSTELYSVSVSELRNEGGSAAVKFIGEWNRKPYRMLIDSANVLYAAIWSQNYASKWNISEPFREQRFHEVGRLRGANWPFTFALDTNGILWMTERNQSVSGNRHKLLKAAVGAKSYQFSVTTVSKPTQRSLHETTKQPQKTTASTTTSSSRYPSTVSTPTQGPLRLKTLSTTHVNEETTEVVKSSSTSNTGTPQPALESNETSDGCAGLVQSQSLNKILIWSLVCCVSGLVLSGTVHVWQILKMRRMQTSMMKTTMDNRWEMSVFPEDRVYDDVAPGNSEPGIPENNPVEPLYSEVDPDYASARNPSPEPYEVPWHLMRNAKAGKPSEPVYDNVGPTEPDNIYDDVGPGPSSGPSRNKKSGRKPTE